MLVWFVVCFPSKNCVAVNKSYVRLNKDWGPDVFFLCPVLFMGTRYLQTSCHLKIMLIFLSVKRTKQKVEKNVLGYCWLMSEVTCLTFTCVFCRILRDNRYLSDIQEDAFEGSTGPSFL